MKAISFSDIKRASWLQGYSEVEMLSIDMDDKVNKVLDALGFDCDYGIGYYAAQHRNLKGEVLIGYLACGDIQINRRHLTGPFSDLQDLLVASCYTDPTLTAALGELSCICRSYDQELSLDDESNFVFPSELVEPTMNAVEKQIAELNELRDKIRGSMYAPDGSLKTPLQYKEYQQEQNNKGNN